MTLPRVRWMVAAVCAFASLAAESAPRLAFQVYAVRDLCEKDFKGTLKAAKALGYEGVETGRFYGLDAKGLKAACDEAGLELVALQLYPHNLTEPQLEETIRFCKDCGCRRINVAWYKGSAENPNDWQLLVNVLNHAAEVCAKEGIAVAYHNHDHEVSAKSLEWLFDEGKGARVERQVSATPRFSPQVLQEFDPGWCVLAGGDPLAWIKAHPRRNPTVHVMPAIEAGAKLPPAGECGVGSARDAADWLSVLPALAADGTEWFVVKPTSHPDSLADLAASAKFVRGVMENTAAACGRPGGDVAVRKSDAAAKPVRTGVYAGRGISGNGATEWFRIVKSSPELELSVVDSEAIRAGGLDGLDVLVMPGGSSPDIKKDLGPKGTERIKDFIRGGGGYFGTCAGCCLMMEEAPDPSRGIGVMPFYRSGSKGRFLLPVELNKEGAEATGLKPGTYSIQYSHGPILEPSTQLVAGASFKVFGVNRTDSGKHGKGPEMYGRAAIVGGTYGKGRVFVTACHPEFFENSRVLVRGGFRFITGRDITLPVRPRSTHAYSVAYYSVYPIGMETAKAMLSLDANRKIDLFPVNDEDIRRGLLDHCDALVFPHAFKGKMERVPRGIVERFASRGGFVLGWGGGTSRVPGCCKAYACADDALAALAAKANEK